jgi:uroporphyrinogen decarboxylase
MHMHSHGYIVPLMDKIIETGVDILNPVGPGDNMDLAQLKQRYGDRVVLNGGISKYIEHMSHEEMERHIHDVIRVGSRGGGFMACSEGGIPYTFSQEDFRFYVATSRKYRERYGNSGTSC